MKRKANNDDHEDGADADGLLRQGRDGKDREVDDDHDNDDANGAHDEDRFDPMTAPQGQPPPRKKRGPANGGDDDIYRRTKNRLSTRAAHRHEEDTRAALMIAADNARRNDNHPGNGHHFTVNVTNQPQEPAVAAGRSKSLTAIDGTGEGGGVTNAGVGRLGPGRRQSWSPRKAPPSNSSNSIRGPKDERFQKAEDKPRRLVVNSKRSSSVTHFAAVTTLDSDTLRLPSDEKTAATDSSRTSRKFPGQRTSRTFRIVTAATMIVVVIAAGIRALTQDAWEAPVEMGRVVRHPHILPPRRRSASLWRRVLPRSVRRLDVPHIPEQGNLTLRQVLSDPNGYHLAMAPAFFGFYGYFGALAAWEEEVGRHVLEPHRLLSVAGASAGAMTAVLLASEIPPRTAASFVSTMTVGKFADFPGILAAFRGNKFEAIMEDFLRQHAVDASNSSELSTPVVGPPQMQDSRIPVAVSAFDIQSLTGTILRTGSMARAARASATFPFLFQPVGYHVTSSSRDDNEKVGTRCLLIDGGLTDFAGLQGTKDVLSRVATASDKNPTRHTIINLSVGDFLGAPPGPAYFDEVNGTALVVSISLQRLPACGPWAMSNGPKAVEASLKAMKASLDVPLFLGRDPNHYELHIDTRGFWKQD